MPNKSRLKESGSVSMMNGFINQERREEKRKNNNILHSPIEGSFAASLPSSLLNELSMLAALDAFADFFKRDFYTLQRQLKS